MAHHVLILSWPRKACNHNLEKKRSGINLTHYRGSGGETGNKEWKGKKSRKDTGKERKGKKERKGNEEKERKGNERKEVRKGDRKGKESIFRPFSNDSFKRSSVTQRNEP